MADQGVTDPPGHLAAEGNGGRRRDAFTMAFREHYGALYAYARRRTDASDAEEVVAETFMVAWRRWEIAPAGRERPWLYGIARKVLANHHRGRLRQQRLLQRESSQLALRSVPLPEDHGLVRAASRDFQRAWGRLGPDDRELLLLAAWEGLDHNEIAEVVGCSAGAARVRLHRARKRLRSYLDETSDVGDTGDTDYA